MDRIVIHGGEPLRGRINISGAKNAVLPIMAAALLTKDVVIIINTPRLADVSTMSHLLVNHGAKISICGNALGFENNNNVIQIHSEKINNYTAPYDIVRKMRASVLVLGPLLARFGKAEVSLPGGCAIGTRPIDLHIKALESMGAKITLDNGYIEASVKSGLKGAEINFEVVSVGATENIITAATLANGTTVINNAAQEPEIIDLVHFLRKMGAKISGEGTSTIKIEGVAELKGVSHKVIPDRIEAATYATAAIITGGEVILENMRYDLFSNVADKLQQIGADIKDNGDNVIVKAAKHRSPMDIKTGPYPGFPTDMQAQLMSLLALTPGVSVIQEDIFENRYMHVSELRRMGADISIQGNIAKVTGIENFYGAEVMATDIRASVSLVIAALAAKGQTIINRVYHIDRGYENIESKLSNCGAKISRVI